MIRAVTLDAHHTLIAPHPGVGAVYAEVAAGYGLLRDASELDAAFPPAFGAVRARWLSERRVPYGETLDDARRFWVEVVEATFAEPLPYEIAMDCFDTFALPTRWRVLDNVRAGLALIAARGLPMAVVSNFDGRLPAILRGLDLGPFAHVIISAERGAAKPEPALLLHAAESLRVAPSELLHIGDSEHEDGTCAAAVGARWLRASAAGFPLTALTELLA